MEKGIFIWGAFALFPILIVWAALCLLNFKFGLEKLRLWYAEKKQISLNDNRWNINIDLARGGCIVVMGIYTIGYLILSFL